MATLLFIGLVVLAIIYALFGDDDERSVRRCPDCGLKELTPRYGRSLDRPEYFQCVKCGARYRIGIDGRMVRG